MRLWEDWDVREYQEVASCEHREEEARLLVEELKVAFVRQAYLVELGVEHLLEGVVEEEDQRGKDVPVWEGREKVAEGGN